MDLKCIKDINGLTIGKTYKLLGCAGELVVIEDDNGKQVTMYESNFEQTK